MHPGVKSSFNIRPPAQKNHLLWKGCLILRSSTNRPLCTQVRVQRQWTSTIPFMALMPPSEQCFSSAHGLGLAQRTSSVRVTCPANQAVPRNPPVWDGPTPCICHAGERASFWDTHCSCAASPSAGSRTGARTSGPSASSSAAGASLPSWLLPFPAGVVCGGPSIAARPEDKSDQRG